jgi:O-antigen/teichoic acid export membrane protein
LLRLRIAVPEILRAIRYAWALPLATFGAFLLQWMDLWFIRAYLDEVSVGHYAWAYTFTLLVTGILVPMAAVLAPKAIDMVLDKHVEGLRKLLGPIFSICMLSGALLPIVLATMAGIGASVVPEKYLMSWPVVLVLSAALLCQMGMAFVEPVVYAQERLVPQMALIVMVMVLVKAIANILLIGSIGMIGSAVATVMCYGVGMLLQWRLLRRHLGLNIPGSWPIFASASTAMIFGASWQAGVGPEWFFALGGGLTIGCLIVFRRAGFFGALPTDLRKLIGFRIYRWLVKA